ncbi:MAG: hypothetical protein DMF57_02635 [Acidobacteria bacterium]|nr:MAG: hypothetical protein DMF57_02635 [Acidobacteriota bacterium]
MGVNSAPAAFPGSKDRMQINLVPDLSLFAVMAIFIVNYFVVSRFFLRPINDVLEAREAEARTAQETYERSLADFNQRTAEIEERFHATRRDASQLRERFRAEAGTHRASLIERTTAEAKKLVAEAEERLRRQVAEARQKIARESESLARLVAERILGRAV